MLARSRGCERDREKENEWAGGERERGGVVGDVEESWRQHARLVAYI